MKIMKFVELLNEARDLKLEKEMKEVLIKELKSVKMSRSKMLDFIEDKYKSTDNIAKVARRIVDDVIYKERANLKTEKFKKKNAVSKVVFYFLDEKAKDPKGYNIVEVKAKEKKEPVKKEKKPKKEGGEGLKFGTKEWREFHGVGKKNELFRFDKFLTEAKTDKNVVKSKQESPNTGKKCNDLHVKDKGVFRWNTTYKVYNSVGNYDQLMKKDLKNIDWTKSK